MNRSVRSAIPIAVILMLLILVSLQVTPGMAEGPKTELKAAPRSVQVAPPEPPQIIDGHATGFVPPSKDLSHVTAQMPRVNITRDGYMLSVSASSLPDVWDWRTLGKVTPVKDQGSCGSCYAFTSIGQIESKLLIDESTAYDFSENSAKECNWYELNTTGDNCVVGGNADMLANLFSQKGTALESCDPYQASDVNCNSACAYQKTLLDWRIISGDTVPSTDVLKAYIQTYGPIYTTVYVGSQFSGYDGSFTINYGSSSKTNHAVLIVGWSNNLPPVSGNPAGPPAEGWIVKNSWGTDWGDGGYFYITYGSGGIGKWSSFMYDWQDYDPQGDLLYYDEAGWTNDIGCGNTTAWSLSKFIPQNDTTVTRVEFWTTDATTDIDVFLYDDFDGTTLSGLLASKETSGFDEPGYHSVELDSPLSAAAGNDIFAVVKFTNESWGYPLAVDRLGALQTDRTYGSCDGLSGPWVDLTNLVDPRTKSGYNGTIRLRTSNSADVSLEMGLQGSSRPESGWQIPVTVKFFTPGADVLTTTPLYEFATTTTEFEGLAICTVDDVAAGSYDVTVVSEHTLQNVKRNVTITAPSTSVDMGTLLEGDANGDGVVDISDFTLLAASFMKMKGDTGFNASADFDRNGIVDITDFTLLAGNFMKMSPVEVE